MSLKTCLIPVNGYDWKGLGAWLEKMAAQGLRYVFATADPDAPAHTEPEVLEYALNRLCRRLRWKALGVGAAICGNFCPGLQR